jgi:hypothetical protein
MPKVTSLNLNDPLQLDIFKDSDDEPVKDVKERFRLATIEMISMPGNQNLNFSQYAIWNNFRRESDIELDRYKMSIWLTEFAIMGDIKQELDGLTDEFRYYSIERWTQKIRAEIIAKR